MRAPFLLLLTALLAALAAGGCVQRRMMVRSNPPGAMVYIDDQPIGHTPVSVPFTYYGTRNFRLIKDGFETATQPHNVPAPWYEYPPVDFVSENLWPWEVRDERVIDFTLVPQQRVPENELLNRAEGLRRRTTQGISTPIPGGPLAPPGAIVPGPGAAAPGGFETLPPPGPTISGFPPPDASSVLVP
jgi:hypothetical protein